MKYLLLALLSLMVTPGALAQNAPFTFQKEQLIIHPKKPSSSTFQQGVLLDVDIHDTDKNYKQDWLQLKGYASGTGLLEIYPQGTAIYISQKPLFAAVDAIVMDLEGRIVMIAPELVLGSLSLPIERSGTMRAILYTEAGFSNAVGLAIGDDVEHKLFIKPPAVVDTVETPPKDVAAEIIDTPATVRTREDQATANPEERAEESPSININTEATATSDADANDNDGEESETKPTRRRPISNPVSPTSNLKAPAKIITSPKVSPEVSNDALLESIIKRHQVTPQINYEQR